MMGEKSQIKVCCLIFTFPIKGIKRQIIVSKYLSKQAAGKTESVKRKFEKAKLIEASGKLLFIIAERKSRLFPT